MKKEESKKFMTTMVCPDCGGRIIVEATLRETGKYLTTGFFCEDCGETAGWEETDWNEDGIVLSPRQILRISPVSKKMLDKYFFLKPNANCTYGDGEKILVHNDVGYVSFLWYKRPDYKKFEKVVDILANGLNLPGWENTVNHKSIKTIAYQKYQLDWMISHGHSLKELFDILNALHEDDTCSWQPSYYFDTFEEDCGFGGELYVCMDEFLSAEYLDKAYMEYLLSEEEFCAYQDDVMKLDPPSAIRCACCSDCSHYGEVNCGGYCYYYGEESGADDPAFDCTHFESDAKIKSLCYDGEIIVENILSDDVLPVNSSELEDFVKSYEITSSLTKLIRGILNDKNYSRELWSLV